MKEQGGKNMKESMTKLRNRLAFTVTAFFLVFAGVSLQTAQSVYADTIVYETPTGSKYHTHKCGNGNYYESTLSHALSRGLEPCSKCYGSSYGGGSSVDIYEEPEDDIFYYEEYEPELAFVKSKRVLLKGQSVTLELEEDCSNMIWSSSNPKVATVNQNGKVTAKSKGTAQITVATASQSVSCKVTVEKAKLSKSSIQLEAGKTYKLKMSGCKHTVSWSSTKTSVATVKKGKVKAKAVGTAVIKAKVHGKSFKCKVKVKRPKITGFQLSKTTVTLSYNEEIRIDGATVPAKNLSYYKLQAGTSNSQIATATVSDGQIRIVAGEMSGNANITVKCGDYTSVCTVNVQPCVITKMAFSENTIEIYPGNDRLLSVDMEPYYASYKYDTQTWTSSNEEVVTVTASSTIGYGKIMALACGEADVTVQIGSYSATCHVVVNLPQFTQLELTAEEVELEEGDTRLVWLDSEPYYAMEYYSPQWYSEDENVCGVRVSENSPEYATIEAYGAGETTVHVNVGGQELLIHVIVTRREED